MAQAGIALAKIPLASPQPTAPPHPRDLDRQLYQRGPGTTTCGWVDMNPAEPQECPPGYFCVYTLSQRAANCCNSDSYPSSCDFPTTCYDSTAVESSCLGSCTDNSLVGKCTFAGLEYCLTKIFSYSILGGTLVTGWDCNSVPDETLFVFDKVTSTTASSSGSITLTTTTATASSTVVAVDVSYVTLGPSSSGSKPTSVVLGPTTTSTAPLGGVTAPSPKSSLSGGAIAGIVIGVILLVVIVLGMILLYRYFKGRNPPPPPSPQLPNDTTRQPISMATVQQGSPPLSNQASNFTAPSNAPLFPPPVNELSPDESKVGSYPTSHSAVGAFPQFSVQHGGQPPASPRAEFGSMTPVHAPDVNLEYTFVPKGPQQ